MTRENDQTQGMATGAVIIAAIRSGGTFLSHCLSNHPQVFCARGEPLHHKSEWVTALKPNRQALLSALLNQTGYKVSMCKLTYAQAMHAHIWPWLQEHKPKIVWLRRGNYVRQAVSVLVNRAARAEQLKRPQHTFSDTGPLRVTFEPEDVLKWARRLRDHDRQVGKRLCNARDAARLYTIWYADVVGGEHLSADRLPTWTAMKLCTFLAVPHHQMRCDLKRVNPYPLREMLTNWKAVEKAVRASEFAKCLEDEQAWTS